MVLEAGDWKHYPRVRVTGGYVASLLVASCALPDFHRLPDEASAGSGAGSSSLSAGGASGSEGSSTLLAGQNSGGKGVATSAGDMATAGAGSGGIGPSAAGDASTGGISNQGGIGAAPTFVEGGSSITGLGGTAAAFGGASVLGGSTSAGTSAGGATMMISTGGTATSGSPSVTGGSSSATGSSGTTSVAGKAGGAGDTGNAGTAGSTGVGTAGIPSTGGAQATGGVPGLVYNVVEQSCTGGLTCETSTSCCTQLEVPAGGYQMGTNTDASRNTDESPPHTATVDRFTMDKFEVTVGRFRKFATVYDGTMPQTGLGAHTKIANSGWQLVYKAMMPASSGSLQSMINCSPGSYQTWTETAGVHEMLPMNCVSWYVAFAFCIWDGGRLPTEAEWEMAASNAANETRFPWGSTDPDPTTHAVMNCMGDGVSGCSPSDILAVGSRPSGASQLGHLDLAGSLWEWTLDFYDANYYQAVGTCGNCANLSGSTPRVIRGGSFTSTLISLRATGRASKSPITVDPYAGFRCARTP